MLDICVMEIGICICIYIFPATLYTLKILEADKLPSDIIQQCQHHRSYIHSSLYPLGPSQVLYCIEVHSHNTVQANSMSSAQ